MSTVGRSPANLTPAVREGSSPASRRDIPEASVDLQRSAPIAAGAPIVPPCHNAGVANGGTSIEDPPGVRPNGAYLAYLRDPDGHKLVGVARQAA